MDKIAWAWFQPSLNTTGMISLALTKAPGKGAAWNEIFKKFAYLFE